MATDATIEGAEAVREAVRRGYGAIAQSGGSCCGGPSEAAKRAERERAGGCCGPAPEQVIQTLGYAAEEMRAVPEEANMGLSCGNPTAIAALKPGEVVLDLGSGGGLDVFLAGPKVGAAGRAIGVDMTPEMMARARRATAAYRERTGLDNVEFRLGEIEHLPVADASVDVVISNCVLNLSPDKARVWREIARVLRPGGRVAVSDLALLRPLPEAVAGMVRALIGCVAGAVTVEETRRMMEAAGLGEIRLAPKAGYVEAMADWNDPLYREIVAHLPEGTKAADFITSLNVEARKPAAPA